MSGIINSIIGLFNCIPNGLISLMARYALGMTFFRSFLTKVDESYLPLDKTYSLFKNFYFAKLPLPGNVIEILTVIGTYAELVLPVLLFLGLFSRIAALGLLIMTLVIQFIVFPADWTTYHGHMLWAVCALFIMKYGPGPLSLDYIFGKRSS